MAPPAAAITAGDVVDKMEPKEQNAYLAGALDMAALFFERTGKSLKAECAWKWYLDGGGAVREIMGVFGNYKDKEATALLDVLIKRRCGD